MFDELDFIYLPSRDVATDLARFTDEFGGEVVFAIERFGTRVAMLRLAPGGPPLLLAQHLEGDQPVLLYRVGDLDAAVAELAERGVSVGARFEFPYGAGAELVNAAPQRIAIYERTRADRGDGLAGRRDF